MTPPAMTGSAGPPLLIDGVDLDAVAAVVRGCPAVDDLCSGAWGGVVSYLPGRQVPGLRIAPDHVVISVRSRWQAPVTDLARQIRAAVTPLVGTRRVEIVIAEVADSAAVLAEAGPRVNEVSSWTTSSSAGRPGAPSSAPIIPTPVVKPPPSSTV